MRVLHLDLGREMRGGQYQALALARGLQTDCRFMARRDGLLLGRARDAGLRVVPFSPLELWLAGSRCDIGHAHDSMAHQWMAGLVSRPFVVSRRVAFPIANNALNRWKYNRAAHFIAVSEYVKGVMVKSGVPVTKINVVYDGVDVPAVAPSSGMRGRVLAIETHDPMKGSALIRQAATIGGFEVKFTDRLMQDIGSADVFLYITRSEGLGSAALIAMAYGVPVVASRVGGLPEIVVDGKTGVLTENDPKAIAAAVDRAYSNREAMRKAAREHVIRRFTKERMVEDTLSVYKKVLLAR